MKNPGSSLYTASGKLVAKNTVINLVGQLLPLLVGIITIPMLIRGLGTERFGLLTLAWVVIGYFSLFDLGLGRALTQIIARCLDKEGETELPGLVWTALAIMAVMGLVGALIAVSSTPLLIAKVFKMPEQLRPETVQAFYLLSLSIPIVVISSGCTGILTAYQRFDLIYFVRTPLALTNYIVPLLVLPFSRSLVPVTLLLVVSRLVSCIAQFWLCLRVMPSLRAEKRFVSGAIKELLSFGGWMTVSNIIWPFMVYLDRFAIGAVISVAAVAYYATPYEMATKLWILSGALIASLFPAFAAGNNDDVNHSIQLLRKSITAIFVFIFPIVLVMVTFSQEILTIWLGRDFADQSALVLQWLAAGVLINSVAHIVSTMIQGRGRPDLTAKIHLLELIFYLPFLWWVLTRHGIAGAAAAWTVRVTVDGLLLLWVTQSLIPSSRTFIFKLVAYLIVATFLLGLCGFPDSLQLRAIFFCFSGFIFVAFSVMYFRLRR